jgi:hypothetical protein
MTDQGGRSISTSYFNHQQFQLNGKVLSSKENLNINSLLGFSSANEPLNTASIFGLTHLSLLLVEVARGVNNALSCA